MKRATSGNAARKRLTISELVQLGTRTQMSFGGTPKRTLRSSKSESFETMVKPLALRVFPDRGIVSATQSALMNVCRTSVQIGQQIDQLRGKIFVKEKLHAFSISSLRSRSAANARHARISCSVK